MLLDGERVTIFPGLFHVSKKSSFFNSKDLLVVFLFHLIARQKLTNSSGCVYIQPVIRFVVRQGGEFFVTSILRCPGVFPKT